MGEFYGSCFARLVNFFALHRRRRSGASTRNSPLSDLRERQYAPVRANVRDPLTTLNIEQLKLVGNIERSNFAINGDVNDNGACVERENKRNRTSDARVGTQLGGASHDGSGIYRSIRDGREAYRAAGSA